MSSHFRIQLVLQVVHQVFHDVLLYPPEPPQSPRLLQARVEPRGLEEVARDAAAAMVTVVAHHHVVVAAAAAALRPAAAAAAAAAAAPLAAAVSHRDSSRSFKMRYITSSKGFATKVIFEIHLEKKTFFLCTSQ